MKSRAQTPLWQGTVGILRATKHYRRDLLFVGTAGAGRLRRALVGSVASRVLHEAECDALIVPDGSFGAPHSRSVLGERRPHAATSTA